MICGKLLRGLVSDGFLMLEGLVRYGWRRGKDDDEWGLLRELWHVRLKKDGGSGEGFGEGERKEGRG